MEMFGVESHLDETLGKNLELDDFYTPHLSMKEMMRMENKSISQKGITPKVTFNQTKIQNFNSSVKRKKKRSLELDFNKDLKEMKNEEDVYSIVSCFLTQKSNSKLSFSKNKISSSSKTTPRNTEILPLNLKNDQKYLNHVQKMNEYIQLDITERCERYSVSRKSSLNSLRL